MMTASERQQRARLGGLACSLRHDPRTYTANARAAQLAALERQVDPDGTLDPDERDRRVAVAQRERMCRMAFASARARSKTPTH